MKIKVSVFLAILMLFFQKPAFSAVSYTKPQAKSAASVQKSVTQKAVPQISDKQRQKYYLDYLQYLKDTVISTCGYTKEQIFKEPISFRFTFDKDSKLQNLEVTGNGDEYPQINRDKIKLYSVNYKPFDTKYMYINQINSLKIKNKYSYVVHLLDSNISFIYKFRQQMIDSDKLNEVWDIPENSIGLRGTVHVKYKLSNFYRQVDGNVEQTWKLDSVNIIKSSGDEIFDSSFIIALKRLPEVDMRVPNTKDYYEFDLDFFVVEDSNPYRMKNGNLAPAISFMKMY